MLIYSSNSDCIFSNIGSSKISSFIAGLTHMIFESTFTASSDSSSITRADALLYNNEELSGEISSHFSTDSSTLSQSANSRYIHDLSIFTNNSSSSNQIFDIFSSNSRLAEGFSSRLN